MTNPCSPRFTGFIRDVRSSKRYLQQTLSQVSFCVFVFLVHYSQSFHPSLQQPSHQALAMISIHHFFELTPRQHRLWIPIIFNHHKQQMNCFKQMSIPMQLILNHRFFLLLLLLFLQQLFINDKKIRFWHLFAFLSN